DAQIWERPWSLEEIRQHSANWSLAADSGLFHFLQDFSQRMMSKTHEIEKQLDSLICDTKATDSRLHSVFNDFLMLSNTQFIENRVYDEEVEETVPKADALEKQPEQEKTREQKEAELIPKMQEAVNYGLKVLESAFEHLDVKAGNSDSEDEDITERVEPILEPKDLYVDRPLPYLIGSQAFMEQEDVGLGDLSSDMSVDSDRDSVIDSEKSSMVSYEEDEEEEEDSDIFGESDKDDDIDDSKKTGPSSFADELAARIKGETVIKPEGERPLPSAEEDSDDMFKPPKMEDEDFFPFGGRSGLFSGGKGLFDNDDDEGDLFSEAPKPVMEETKTNVTVKDNSLFSSGRDSDSEERTENGSPAVRTSIAPKQTPTGAAAGGGGGKGLFDDDEEEDDDFFSGKSLKKPDSVQEKPKPKSHIDLFDDEDDEDGDIFSGRAPPSTQSKREVVEKTDKPSEKKPPGAISMFGPATKSLLSEGLKKRQASTSEESEKSDMTEKPQSGGLFSDDEDSQKPEPTSLGKTSKASLLLFDDEEEEDLFASAAKSKGKTTQSKPSVPQPSTAASSSLFSDDEQDQWMGSKSSTTKPESKTGGLKTSTSAPSSLPSAKASQKSSLFDEEEDDLFAPPEESQKKPQKVALLFEDEGDDDDEGSLFVTKPVVTNAEPPAKAPAAASQASSLPEEVAVSRTAAKEEAQVQQKPAEKPPKPLPGLPSQESTAGKKKPAGAMSLFGGIDLPKEGPPPIGKEEDKKDAKGKTKTVSLFDDDGDDEDESDWSDPIFVPSQPTAGKTQKPAEERPQTKSTGVFQDEELLFSHTQQKDNDPDVDLFATSGKAASEGGVSFETPVQVTTLESAHKTRVKGSVFRRPQTRAARQQAAQKSMEDKSGGLEDILGQTSSLSGLAFPPAEKPSQTHVAPSSNSAAPPTLPAPSSVQPSSTQISPRPSELTLPVTTDAGKKGSSKADSSSARAPLSPDEDDLFGSDSLFGARSVTDKPSKPSTRETTKTSQPHASSGMGVKKDKDISTLPSIFDDNTDDLFQAVKPQAAAKKAPKVSSFMEEDDDDDIFGLSNSSTSATKSSKEIKNGSSFSKQDIFQDEATAVPKVQKKLKEKPVDASLFDDNIDIFADLTDTLKPKQKSKTKGETKSIFDDDMDIFSRSTVKPAAKAPDKLKKTPPSQKTETAADSSNIFDDPLNALGGN
uniref:WASH complex subunit 2C n=1 Tax=Kryptolebias marmoratus TaxID=37003 RepID=A0A3Q2ZRU5_KRYMA